MSYPWPDEPNPLGYIPEVEFQATKRDAGAYVIISNCRKTDSMPETAALVINQCGLKISD